MAISLAPITQEDAADFWAAVDAVSREGLYLARLRAPPLEASLAFVANNIARGYPQFVARDAGQLVGWCDAIGNERDLQDHCATLGMGLLPAWRGQGLGRRLIERTLAAAWARGFRRVELTVNADNLRAQALYRAVGFQVEGRFRAGARRGQGYVDVIAMALLAPGMLSDWQQG